MGGRQKTIDKDLNKSASDFEIYVKPHVLRLLKGKIETVEGVTDDWMTETFICFVILPDPRITHKQINKIINAFKDLAQMELIKVRWEEINRLQTPLLLK